jgi:hypothetical protein
MIADPLKTGDSFIKPAVNIGALFPGGTVARAPLYKLHKSAAEGFGILKQIIPNLLKTVRMQIYSLKSVFLNWLGEVVLPNCRARLDGW